MLRLFPAIPKNIKSAKESCTLPDMTRIEKGSIILYSPYVMGRLESLWGKANNKMMDEQSKGNREENKNTRQSQVSEENEIESSNKCYRAHEFAPERFLSCCKPSHYKLTAFQAGPRVCMGEKLAFTEIKIVLAKLIYNFTFSFLSLWNDCIWLT